MGAVSRRLTITEGNLHNHHLYLTEILDIFPPDTLGGTNKFQAAPRTVRVLWGGEAVDTDIDRTKKIFRRRGWVGRFFKANCIQAGDPILLEQLGPYLYRVSKGEQLQGELFPWAEEVSVACTDVCRPQDAPKVEGKADGEAQRCNMAIPPDHLTYLRQKDYAAHGLEGFTEEETTALVRYGHWMEALVQGRIAPATPDQSHFLDVARGEAEPQTLFERVWRKLRARQPGPATSWVAPRPESGEQTPASPPASPDTLTQLERLGEARRYVEEIRAQVEAERAEVLRTVQAQLEAIEAKYAQTLQDASQAVAELEEEVKAEVLQEGQSVRVEGVQAIFYRGAVTWDSKGLAQYAQANPEVQQFQKVGAPRVQIRYK